MDKTINCPNCRHPGYDYYGHVTKPTFICQKCETIWASGYDGEPYLSELDKRNKPKRKK